MAQELSLLAGAPIKLDALAAQTPEARPTPTDRPLELELQPMADLSLLVKPGREHAADSFGGLLKLVVPRAASYRISSNRRLWIDVVGPEGVVRSSKFAMARDCGKLAKSVAFGLEPDTDYWIQLAGSPTRDAVLLITLDR